MDYKLDSCLTHDDAHVVSGSEDGRVCFWDLVEVSTHHDYHDHSILDIFSFLRALLFTPSHMSPPQVAEGEGSREERGGGVWYTHSCIILKRTVCSRLAHMVLCVCGKKVAGMQKMRGTQRHNHCHYVITIIYIIIVQH